MIPDNEKMKTVITPELPLKMYLFLVKSIDLTTSDKIEICFAYQLDTAFDRIRDIYSLYPGTYTIQTVSAVDINTILGFIEEKKSDPKLEFRVAETEQIEQNDNRLAYVCNLKYALETFADILSDSDKKTLTRIIKKIDNKLAYDAQQNSKK